MRRAHPTAARIEQNPGQQVWLITGLSIGSIDAVLGEDGLHIVPQRLVDDGFMLAWIALALVDDFTPINSVLQHQVERTAGDWLAAMPAAIRGRSDLADNASGIEILLQFPNRLEFGVTPKDVSNRLGLYLIHDELPLFDVVAERERAAHPQALLLGRRDLVTDALTRDLALELGKRQQDIERQAPNSRGVELLGDRHKRDGMPVENVDD